VIHWKQLSHALGGPVGAALLIVSFTTPVGAQTEQVWPEVGAFWKLNDTMRFYFLATTVRENRESTEGEFGPNFDFYLKPIREKKRLALFRLDESKTRFLMVRVGYHYVHSYTGGPEESRGVLEATPRYPLMRGVFVSDRSRMDFRLIEGEFSWRYRNRLTVEREFSIGRLKLNPYARAELYFDSRFHEWSRTALTAGSVFLVSPRCEFEPYYEHQNDTGGSPNRQVNAVGMVVSLYF
jgi:hypothetical protein